MTTIPTDGFYSEIINGFFGNLTPAGKNLLWSNFLTANNLTADPPEDATNEQNFVNFINQTIQNTGAQLSPNEVANRQLLSAVIEAIVKLLGTLHGAVETGTVLQTFYAAAQNEYTNMMARIPWALSGASGVNILPAAGLTPADLSQLTLGYNDISIQDIINTTLALPSTGSQIISFPSSSGNYLSFVPENQAGPIIQILIVQGLLPSTTPLSNVYLVENFSNNQLVAASAVPIVNGNQNAAAQQAFINTYQSPNAVLNNSDTIAWPTNTNSDSDITTREAKNVALSQFVSADTSKQQAIQDTASNAQTVLDASNTAVNGESSLVQKSLQMLKSMLNSMYGPS